MEYYHVAFCTQFNISFNHESSIFAFQNELFLEGAKRYFEKANLKAMDYFQAIGKDQEKIRLEYFISEICNAYIDQYRLSMQIQLFNLCPEQKKHNEQFWDSQFHSYEKLIDTIIKNFKQSSKYTIDTTITE